MIVREKILKEFAVAVFPSLPRLLFQFYQVFFDFVGFRRRGLRVGDSKTNQRKARKGAFYDCTTTHRGLRGTKNEPRGAARAWLLLSTAEILSGGKARNCSQRVDRLLSRPRGGLKTATRALMR